MVHSVIIGISVGASMNPETLKPLVAALTFHQFFEGMGLGGCITQVISPCIYYPFIVFKIIKSILIIRFKETHFYSDCIDRYESNLF